MSYFRKWHVRWPLRHERAQRPEIYAGVRVANRDPHVSNANNIIRVTHYNILPYHQYNIDSKSRAERERSRSHRWPGLMIMIMIIILQLVIVIIKVIVTMMIIMIMMIL